MKYISAYMLLVLAGKEAPSKDEVSGLLSSVGVESEAEKLDLLFSKLEGKNIDELIEQGEEKLIAVGGAGGGGGGGGAAGGAAAEEEKAEEEEEEEEVDVGGGNLFGEDEGGY
mmetsp:Transcript_8270/g.10466  ORF Transcript_8270/g.10466 Transcript_8270/m.10466 type:complete len:113 (+) Transcript_8270:281-619(+)|eukprot:CAMPEP_0204822576 /NCGR_PEP_ID=MMETSP1346-20131115/763_1 /ASSEMBLY_ACC=CAM_ASM_000771 /TAXON_ID=215587 /ORGANISM="Aplanochytrium stocchinoi, Strain GSBS06" /LENGTH=112 /DNA_ID=CAMNT_0051948859 /DNA_START=206 /DNA_END=544 /DNA_ORIENTATION=+